ncbi:Transcription termination factor, mitochondrial/chloroplastic [Sesbania bispinosa]|nr:Transcription termination factor, mitochondrial/chloroplastic [Sesbania bispinosa]
MFNSQRYRILVLLKPPKLQPLLPLPFYLKLKFCTTTSQSESEPDSITVSYLVNNAGFSPESALKASKRVCLKTPEKPDSVFTFFRNHGFSDSNIRDIVKKEPWLLSSDPHNSVLPKFTFFLSKGASPSDIPRMLTANPRILQRSLENYIIPRYDLLKRFLKSDKVTLSCMIRHTFALSYNVSIANIKLMIDYGVCDLGIARLLLTRPTILASTNLLKTLEEVKDFGFDPSKSTFAVAMVAWKGVSKIRWNEKVDVFKKWGWSDETILRAFRREPNVMLISSDKIKLVMSFWVNHLGWDALALTKGPRIIGYSLERRIIPRASVVQFLLKKGLRKKNASLVSPFLMTEKLFLDKFIKCFKEESSDLLKLYEEKLNLAYTRENSGMSIPK